MVVPDHAAVQAAVGFARGTWAAWSRVSRASSSVAATPPKLPRSSIQRFLTGLSFSTEKTIQAALSLMVMSLLFTAVTTLSLLDPVRAFEDYSTLDNLAGGRLTLIIGKGNGAAQAQLFHVTYVFGR